MKPRVAVIDIGSNSIKALVAESNGGPFGLVTVYEESIEVRISRGIGGSTPQLQADRIEAGVEAVERLWEGSRKHGPLAACRIVATSAVRSASNGHVFTRAVEALTGCHPDVLSGAEEADAIAMGVRTDPAIESHLTDFTVFDLGGGSLELIRFVRHNVSERTSLPLGSVRLTEHFLDDPSKPVPPFVAAAIRDHVRASIEATGFRISAPIVGCSGGLAALRHIRAVGEGLSFEEASPFLTRDFIDQLAARVLTQDLGDRIRLAGLPARRADIFPAALLTFQAILELAQADGILHSLHNLRYGLAWRLLHPVPADEGASHEP